MRLEDHTTICGLPRWVGIIRNDTAAFANDVLLATVNGFSAIVAFLGNLAIIVAVIKNPSLQKRSNILLCSLAFPDCLSGIAAQPMFVAWRFFLQTAQPSCLHQLLVFNAYYALNAFTVGLSFVNVVIISFDRHYALSKPFEYLALHKQGAVKIVLTASIIWLLFAILLLLGVHSFAGLVASLLCIVVFLVVPIVNYIRMLLSIRRHNRQLGDVVNSQQMSQVLKREKKVALDMFAVAILLLLSLTPGLLVTILEFQFPSVYSILLPWSQTMSFMSSSINPLYHGWRNKQLSNTLKSMLNIA